MVLEKERAWMRVKKMAKNLDQSIHKCTIPAQVDNFEKRYDD